MRKTFILLAIFIATSMQVSAQCGDRCGCSKETCCGCCKCNDKVNNGNGHRRHDRENKRGTYFKDTFDVYYNGVKISDASASSFKELGRGYAKDAFNVYYEGRKLQDASSSSFVLMKSGYAKDSFNVYYQGRKLQDASPNSFVIMDDGYARDTFNTYYRGKKIN